MGCCCPSDKKTKTDLRKGSAKNTSRSVVNTPLGRDSSDSLFMTHKERVLIHGSPTASMHLRLLLDPPFSTFSAFTQQVYLTGIGGITLDNLKQYNIKCLVNVAEEIPAISQSASQKADLHCYKFNFADNYSFQFGDKLNQVVDLMHKMLKETDGNVVVYCTAGMCRSATVVLAYAIKHMKKSLKDAFNSLQQVRSFARPNLAFFKQLVHFEAEWRKANSVKMVDTTLEIEEHKESDSDKAREKKKKKREGQEVTIKVPDFYKKDYPQLFKLEAAEARVGNCPMASNFTSANRASSTAAVSKVSAASGSQASIMKPNLQSTSKAAAASSSSATSEYQWIYQSNELKPFVVETISYPDVLAELDKERKKKPAMQRATSLGKI